MRLAEQFRTQAWACLRLADEAPTLEIRAYWTDMAQLWHNLAAHFEEAHPAASACSALAPMGHLLECPETAAGPGKPARESVRPSA